jgi:uncharacterized protein (TIGR02996 family)
MPSGDSGLLDEVLAHPDDDAPRLVYADWLTTQDDPRGVFIAEQCRLATLDELHPDWPALYLRTERALARSRQAWTEPLLGLLDEDWPLLPSAFVFARGFPERLHLYMNESSPLAPLQAQIPLRAVEVGRLPLPAQIFRACARAGLRGLKVTGDIPGGALRSLAPEELSLLEEFGLEDSHLAEDGAHELVRLLRPGQLRSLSLPDAALMDGGLALLADCGLLDGCDELDLRQNELDAPGLERLMARGGDRPLSLRLGHNPWLGASVCRLLQRRPLRGLELDWVRAPAEELLAALAAPSARGLRHLHLVGAFQGEGPHLAARLAEIPFEGLTRLSLDGSSLDARGLALLLEAQPGLLSLRLDVSGAEGALETLLSSPHLSRLVELHLRGGLRERDYPALASWPGMRNLAVLDLRGNPPIGEVEIRALLDCPSLDPVRLCPPPGPYAVLRERYGEAVD